MRHWKKAALIVLGLVMLSQVPFIYRRYQLGRLRSNIEALNGRRRGGDDPGDLYADRKGVIHVHSFLGGHSTGEFGEIVEAARANDLSFVVMTEHPAKYVNTSEITLKGIHQGVLFVNGNEINVAADDRLLTLQPGIASAEYAAPLSTEQAIDDAKERGGLVFVAYPEQFRSWDTGNYDGIEIYNLYTNTKKINYALLFFDVLWSYRSYPDLLFSTFYERPAANLQKWDELTRSQQRRLVAIAGNDAHANVGFSLQHLTGEKIAQLKFDPYARSFGTVRTHVLMKKTDSLTRETLLSALASGHTFIGFDVFGESSGFRFTADNGAEQKIMGDEIALAGGGAAAIVRLTAVTPVAARVVFIKDGAVFREEREATRAEVSVGERGVYRVEVYLDQLGAPLSSHPWIISNPIYVR